MDALAAIVAEQGIEPVIDGVLYFMLGDTDAAWHIAHRPAILDELSTISVPLTIVAGTEDHTYPPPKSEQIAQRVPHAELVLMERTGHVYALENPLAVNAVLHDHLTALPAPA
jgi:3-oxoadipate enol-lactonase